MLFLKRIGRIIVHNKITQAESCNIRREAENVFVNISSADPDNMIELAQWINSFFKMNS